MRERPERQGEREREEERDVGDRDRRLIDGNKINYMNKKRWNDIQRRNDVFTALHF